MNRLLGVLVLLVMVGSSARAEVQAVNMVLAFDKAPELFSYRVPAGKVLIIEGVCFSINYDMGSGKDKDLFMDFVGLDTTYQPVKTTFTNNVNMLVRPIKMIAGNRVYVASASSGSEVTVLGLLVDTSDLYASVPSRIDSLNQDGIRMGGSIQLASARPVRTHLETSAELDGAWTRSDGAEIVKTPVSGQQTFSLDMGDATEQGFVRVVARKPPEG